MYEPVVKGTLGLEHAFVKVEVWPAGGLGWPDAGRRLAQPGKLSWRRILARSAAGSSDS